MTIGDDQLAILMQLKTEEDSDKEENENIKKDYSQFDNYTKKRITLIGYLTGLKDEILNNPPFIKEYVEELEKDKKLKIIKSLCRLRTNFLTKYDSIYKIRKTEGVFARFETMDKYLDTSCIEFLKGEGIEPFQTGITTDEFTRHIANINELIEERVEDIHPYIPEWIDWNYIKEIFIMPGCNSGINGCNYQNKRKGKQINDQIHNIRKDFFSNISFYPYGTYINWNPKVRNEMGNILFNDNKFLNCLYMSHYDTFKGSQYVIDAKSDVKNSIYNFVDEAENIAIFVDCENIDPYKFAAVFKNLDEEKMSKIKKIVLYDDVHTTNAWSILNDIINIKIEHEVIERVKEEKSLVDHVLAIGVTRAVVSEHVESVIIASSDSDFWSLIKYVPEARFFVMNEKEITSGSILEKLDDYMIPHCFLDDFKQDSIQPFKNKVLLSNLQSYLDKFNEEGVLDLLDVDELVDEIFKKSGIEVPYKQLMKEKEDFILKYIRKIKLTIINEDENRRLKLVLI